MSDPGIPNSVNGYNSEFLNPADITNGSNGDITHGECNVCCNDVRDVCFIGDYNGRYYPAHRSLLVKASGFFREYFHNLVSNDDALEPIFIRDVEPIALVQCLDFIYTGQLCINTKNLKNFAEAALVLKMDAVWDYCIAYGVTHVNIDTFFDLRMMAASTRSQKLLDATEMFALCNFELLMGHEEFALIDKTLLLFLLKHKKIKMVPERKIYEAVIAWINFIPLKRKHHLPGLLRLVNLEQIPLDYLKDVVHAELLVLEDTECRNLVEEALFCHLHTNCSMEDGSNVLTQHCMVMLSKDLAVAESYNPWSGRWKSYGKPCPYDRCFVSVSVGRWVYIFGEDRQVFSLDTLSNAWREMAKMSTERSEPCVTVLDGLIYICGGTIAATGKGMRTCERFDPENNTWEKIQSMKKPRTKHCLASSRGFVYAIGGLNNNNAAVKLVERISPKQGVWMNAAPMKKARSGALCFVKDESIYVFGGSFAPDDSVEMLNSSGSGWTMITMLLPKNYLSTCAIEDDVFVICNSDSSNESDLEIQELHLGGEKPNFVEKIENLPNFGSLAIVKS